jgi:hypothetical protein
MMMVHRLCSQRDLLVDINLLTSAFPVALADALDRTLPHAVQVIPLPGQPLSGKDDQGFIAAQAG